MIRSFFHALQVSQEELHLNNITYPYAEGYYDTGQRGNPLALVNFQYYPNVWTVKDKTFICWQQRNGGVYNNEDMVVVYDHFTKKVSDSIAWGEINPPNSDVHLMPTIISTDDNKLLMLAENPHNGVCYVKKSGANYDVSTYTTHGFFGGTFAYPHIHKFSDGTLFCIRRDGGNDGRNKVHKSTDNGETWSETGRIMNFGEPNWCYDLTPFSPDDKLRLFTNRRRGSLPVWFPGLYYLESDDGITWSNIQGTFSKNIVSQGAITTAEMEANYEAFYYSNPRDVNDESVIRATGACVGENGKIYAFGGAATQSYEATLLYWDGSNWQSKLIACPGHNINPAYNKSASGDPTPSEVHNNAVGMTYRNGALNLYCMENVGGFSQCSHFRTTDDGDSWHFVEQLTDASLNHWDIHITPNYEQYGRGCIACVRKSADETYGDLFIKEI